MASTKSLSLLQSLQAKTMLEDFAVLSTLQGIQGQMVYKAMPFTDYFDQLQDSISKIGCLKLRSHVDVGEASEYLVDLATGYEQVLDGINRCTIDAQCLLGRVKTLYAKATTLKGPFLVLWSIGAQDIVEETVLKKLNATDMKALAAMEFTTVLQEADLEMAAMIEALEMTLDNLKNSRKLAADKYAIGKDQVNAALSELDQTDRGVPNEKPKTHQTSSAVDTLKGMFPGRVQAPQASSGPAPVEEDDLPPGLDLDSSTEGAPEPATIPYVEAVTLDLLDAQVTPAAVEPPAGETIPDALTLDIPPEGPMAVTEDVPPPATPKKSHHKKKEAAAEMPPPDDDVPSAPVPSPEVVAAILEDPFLGKTKAAEVVAAIGGTAPVATSTPDDDDLPPGDEPAAKPAPDDEDLSFMTSAPVVDKTKATAELAAGAVPPEDEAPAPAPEPPKAVEVKKPAPEPAKPAEAPKPRGGGLFRSKVVPANQTPVAPFKPATPPPAGSSDGLDDFM